MTIVADLVLNNFINERITVNSIDVLSRYTEIARPDNATPD